MTVKTITRKKVTVYDDKYRVSRPASPHWTLGILRCWLIIKIKHLFKAKPQRVSNIERFKQRVNRSVSV